MEDILMKKIQFKSMICILLLIAIITVLIGNKSNNIFKENEPYKDGVEQLDLDSIYLKSSGVQVDFSEVIISNENESRKLIVYEQEATVSTQLTDSLIRKLDFEWLKKTQKVSYTGNGYFVVDLDKLTEKDIMVDGNKKLITIKIGHAYLQAIEIKPEDIVIDEVKEGLLARGDIKLTVADYNAIEKELKEKLDTEYSVYVEFK